MDSPLLANAEHPSSQPFVDGKMLLIFHVFI